MVGTEKNWFAQAMNVQTISFLHFGAFVEILPGTEGLCHISQLSDKRVAQVTDEVNEGDEIMVKVIEIDKMGKIRLSRKDAMKEQAAKAD